MSPVDAVPVKRYPSAGQGVLLVIFALLLQLATGATAFTIAVVASGDVAIGTKLLHSPWILVLVLAVSNTLAIALGLRGSHESARPFLRPRAFQTGLLPAVAATSIGLAILLREADHCIVQFIMVVNGVAVQPPDLLDLTATPVGAAILVVIIAPVTEEYLFRGLLLRGLLTHFDQVKALVISAVAFAIFHANLRQGFLAFIIGLVFGWWYARTRSVGPGMIGHATFNGLTVALAQMPDLAVTCGFNNTLGPPGHVPWWLLLGGLALATTGLWNFHTHARVIGTDPSPPPAIVEPPLLPEPPFLNPHR